MAREPLDPGRIGFRRLAMADLPLLHRWLNAPHVSAWWGAGPSRETVEREYGASVRGEDAVAPYLIRYAAAPIGYIQTYRLADHPDFAAAIGITEDAAGVDLFIGEVGYLHRGLGSAILIRCLREIVFADGAVESCIIDPAVSNLVAIRAYEKVGFRHLKTVPVPDEPEPAYLMRLGRDEFEGT